MPSLDDVMRAVLPEDMPMHPDHPMQQAEPAQAQDEREARDWEMKARGIESVIHYVVSKRDQDVLRRHAADKRAEGKRLAARPAQAEPEGDGMCNFGNPSQRCVCREEFGHRVCGEPASTQDERERVAAALRACDWSSVPIGNKAIIQRACELLSRPAQTEQQPEQSGLVGQVCGGDGTHNTVNVAVVGAVPWGELRIGTPVRLIPAPATPSPAKRGEA